MQADGLHPNEAGQPLLLENVWPKLAPLLRAMQPSRTTRGREHGQVLVASSIRPAVPADIDPSSIASLKALIEDACERYAGAHRLSQHGHRDQLSRSSTSARAPSAPGCSSAPDSRAAIASPSCCRICCSIRSRCSARCAPACGRQHQSALHRRPNSSTSSRIPAPWRSWCWRTSPRRSNRRCPHTSVRQVIVTGVGDLLQLAQRRDRQFVLRHVQQAGAALAHSRSARASTRCSRQGRALRAAAGEPGSQRSGLPAVHRRHHRCRQGRDAHPRQHGGQHPAGARLVPAGRARSRNLRLRAAALPHLFADRRTAGCSPRSAAPAC